MESQINGVKVGICCELAIGNRTNGSGRKAGKSSEGTSARSSGGGGFNKLEALFIGNIEESGGSLRDSIDEDGSSEAAECCRVDDPGGHQQ